MAELSTSAAYPGRPLLSARKIVHISMLAFAFLLPILTWAQAAGCAVLLLLFNLFLLPRLAVDLRKSPRQDIAEGTWTGIILYPLSVLALILLYRHHLHIAAAAWAIMALGDGMASVSGEVLRGRKLPWNRQKTWTGLGGFVVAGTVGAFVLTRWIAPTIPTDKAWMVSAAAAVVGALVESVPIRLDDNVSVPLVTGAFLFCAYLVERTALASNWPYLDQRIILALVVNGCLALLALALKMVRPSGAGAGLVLGTAVYLGYGYKSFLMLFAFFLLGSLATRVGYTAKARRGIAERRGGARSWREALANTLAGAFFSILVITTHHEAAFLLALVAAFAEAAGDTVSSEIGQWISDRAYLITTFRPVPAGVDGGISFGGTLAGLLASAVVVAAGYGLGLCGIGGAAIALTAAFAGNLLDSVLGATIEQRGLVTNGIVNFAGTSFAGGLALAITFGLGW
ncbi:MAG: DUF92 domain-containing protein [Acidobacteriia bacterium]|nr:DUF92 domain-containing protein [Terriglobia bacterium]